MPSRRDIFRIPIAFSLMAQAQQPPKVRPFRVEIPQATIKRIQTRVREARLPDRHRLHRYWIEGLPDLQILLHVRRDRIDVETLVAGDGPSTGNRLGASEDIVELGIPGLLDTLSGRGNPRRRFPAAYDFRDRAG